MTETILLKSDDEARKVFGTLDENIKMLEDLMHVEIYARGRQIQVKGSKKAVHECAGIIQDLRKQGNSSSLKSYILERAMPKAEKKLNKDTSKYYFHRCHKHVEPKTAGQLKYVKAIRDYDVVFGIGPAGTGKTYLAMASAIEAFKKQEVERIVLTRPAVETGEKLGFLPGDLSAKINPYLKPVLDALSELMSPEEVTENFEKNRIEICPLGYMRGRTLNDSFVILDEAQNSTPLQMKMFLTRLGFGSTMVVTGDITQIDFPKPNQSGLLEVARILKNVSGIKMVYLDEKDIVRHPLVKSILRAYDLKGKK